MNQDNKRVDADVDLEAQAEAAARKDVPEAEAEEVRAREGRVEDVPLVDHDSIETLQGELEQALAKAEENWGLYLRAQAELQNFRKRSERDLSNAHKFALEKFVGALLPVKDSLEMGISAAAEAADVGKLLEGTELTLKMLTSVLEKSGISEVNPLGERFNPELHEAMAMQPSEQAQPNTVLQVIQKGYLLNDRLVRPAMVIVSQAVKKA
jgi:molecular chaperone GrpE